MLRRIVTALVAVTAVSVAYFAPAEAEIDEPLGRAAPARTAASNPTTLLAGHSLVAGTSRDALSNGSFILNVSSGLVSISELIPVPGPLGETSWGTGTWFRDDVDGRSQKRHDHTRLRLNKRGDLLLLTASGRRLWHSGTGGLGGVELILHSGGNLVLHKRSGKAVWSSHSGRVLMSGGMTLEPGQRLRDALETAHKRGQVLTLTMKKDGNLVHRCGKRIDWQTHTSVAGSTLQMGIDGGLRVVAPSGRVTWSAHTEGHDYAVLNGKYMWVQDTSLDVLWYARLHSEVCPG